MKNLPVLLLSVVLFTCNRKETNESFPVIQIKQSEWSIYEGTIVTDDGELFDVEISLKEAPFGGESHYELGGNSKVNKFSHGFRSVGKYVVTPGLPNNAFGIQLLADQKLKSRFYDLIHMKHPSKDEQEFIRSLKLTLVDFYFRTNGDGQMILTDGNFTPVGADRHYTLYKRSKLFTVEGYVTIPTNDSSKFLEQNVQKEWIVAPLGVYDHVKDKYLKIVAEPGDSVYLRALAYTISDSSAVENSGEFLVLKSVVRIGDGKR